jgi:site-specific DNA recombinase
MDFYELHSLCEKYGVAIVSLKEDFDTSSAIGRAVLKILLVFYELEREQTSERTAEASRARAERGLWNGGQILGYDLDPEKKGTLIPNPQEKEIVTFIFTKFLETGSVPRVMEALKEKGFKTKTFTSRRGKEYPSKEFTDSSLRTILRNRAYIGELEVAKHSKNSEMKKIVSGQWEPILDRNLFERVQELYQENRRRMGNAKRRTRKNYLLAGLVLCGKCLEDGHEIFLEPSSGTSRTGKVYFYYRCNHCTKVKVSAERIETAVKDRFKKLAQNPDLIEALIKESRKYVSEEIPKLRAREAQLMEQRVALMKNLDAIIEKMKLLDNETFKSYIKGKEKEFGDRISQVDTSIEEVRQEIKNRERESISPDLVMETLQNFTDVFDHLDPYEQQQFLKIFVKRIELYEDELRVEIVGDQYVPSIKKNGSDTWFSQPMEWLPCLFNRQNFSKGVPIPEYET